MEIQKLLKSLIPNLRPDFNVFHHETNGIAHRLAHLANSHYQNFICLNETPVIIQDAPFKEQYIEKKRTGFV